MDVKHAHAQLSGFSRRSAHGVWDIVELQIEKNSFAPREKVAYQDRAFGREEFRTHLEHADAAVQPVGHPGGGLSGRKVQGNNQSFFRGQAGLGGHRGHSSGCEEKVEREIGSEDSMASRAVRGALSGMTVVAE